MATIYVPEVVGEDCEILMAEREWWDDDMLDRDPATVYVKFDEYQEEVVEYDNKIGELEDANWQQVRTIHELEQLNIAFEENIAVLTEERDEAREVVKMQAADRKKLEERIMELEEQLAN